MVKVIITHRNDNPNTIWNRLAAQLGREPTNAEAVAEVRRILAEGRAERIKPPAKWSPDTARQRVGGTFGS